MLTDDVSVLENKQTNKQTKKTDEKQCNKNSHLLIWWSWQPFHSHNLIPLN